MGECFFWYRLTRVVPDRGPLNGCVCVCACLRACVRVRVRVCRKVKDHRQLLVHPTHSQSHLLLVLVDTVVMYRHIVSLLSALAVTDVECRRVIFNSQATVNGLISLLDVACHGNSFLSSKLFVFANG